MAGLLRINDINRKQSSAGTNQPDHLGVRTAPYQPTRVSIESNMGLPAADGVHFLLLTVFGFEKCGAKKCQFFGIQNA